MHIKVMHALVPAVFAFAQGPTFLLAGLSLTPQPWDKPANLEKLERYARQAAGAGTQVVVTPEGFLEGYVGNIVGENGGEQD